MIKEVIGIIPENLTDLLQISMESVKPKYTLHPRTIYDRLKKIDMTIPDHLYCRRDQDWFDLNLIQ